MSSGGGPFVLMRRWLNPGAEEPEAWRDVATFSEWTDARDVLAILAPT